MWFHVWKNFCISTLYITVVSSCGWIHEWLYHRPFSFRITLTEGGRTKERVERRRTEGKGKPRRGRGGRGGTAGEGEQRESRRLGENFPLAPATSGGIRPSFLGSLVGLLMGHLPFCRCHTHPHPNRLLPFLVGAIPHLTSLRVEALIFQGQSRSVLHAI